MLFHLMIEEVQININAIIINKLFMIEQVLAFYIFLQKIHIMVLKNLTIISIII